MKVAFSIILLSFLICLSSFDTFHDVGPQRSYDIAGPTPDTTLIGNRVVSSGGKVMTDQDALVVLVEPGTQLTQIDLYFSQVSTTTSDSSRLFVKTQRSWSCAPLGNANPLQVDQYTLALSNNVAVQVGWNTYTFDTPVSMISDTIYIWPDLIQQVQPRVVWTSGNHPDLRSLTGTACANPGSDTSLLDYSCELTFVTQADCIPFLEVLHSDSVCYAADTILARTTIDPQDSITFLSSHEVILDTIFSVEPNGQLLIDMEGCNN